MSPIERVVKAAGSQAALARAINRSQAEISQWVTGRRRVAATACRAIEAAYPGIAAASELRPDVFGDPARTKNEVVYSNQK